MNKDFRQLKSAINRRRRASLLWKIFLFITLLFMLEIPLPPIPPTMAFPLALLSLIFAGHSFYLSARLPIREAILLAKANKGYLSVPLLCAELDLDIAVAEAIIRVMDKKGLLSIDDSEILEGGDIQYRVHGLLPPSE